MASANKIARSETISPAKLNAAPGTDQRSPLPDLEI